MSKRKNRNIDVENTKRHHNYYGEEADPELQRLLNAHRNGRSTEPTAGNGNTSDDGTVDLCVAATPVAADPNGGSQNSAEIDENQVEVIDEGYGEL